MKTKLSRHALHFRSFWMLLSLALAATLLLAACGGSSTTATTSTPTATTPPAPTTAPSPTPSPTTGTQPVVMKVSIVGNGQYSFQPAMLTVKVGTQVVWTNTSSAPHTITSDNGAFTASSVIQEQSTFSMTFTTAGTYHYHCSIHPYMTATIVVTS